jgi:hypothetical protein
LLRWAYPASQAYRDISKHGTLEDSEEMEEIIRQEREEEKKCIYLTLKGDPTPTNSWLRGVTTRRGTRTHTPEDECTRPGEGDEKGPAGTDTPETPSEPSPKGPPETKSLPPPRAGEEEDEMPALEESSDTEDEEPQEEVPARDGLGDARAHFAQAQEYPPEIWNISWVEAYEQCDIWSPIWASDMDATATWPKDYKVLQQRLYKD